MKTISPSISRNTTRLALTATALVGLSIPLQADIGVKEGEKIAFLGDSITQAGARPNGYVRLVIRGLESPE